MRTATHGLSWGCGVLVSGSIATVYVVEVAARVVRKRLAASLKRASYSVELGSTCGLVSETMPRLGGLCRCENEERPVEGRKVVARASIVRSIEVRRTLVLVVIALEREAELSCHVDAISMRDAWADALAVAPAHPPHEVEADPTARWLQERAQSVCRPLSGCRLGCCLDAVGVT